MAEHVRATEGRTVPSGDNSNQHKCLSGGFPKRCNAPVQHAGTYDVLRSSFKQCLAQPSHVKGGSVPTAALH
eukprot:14821802-Alexandrium_andersonii.AAC.1